MMSTRFSIFLYVYFILMLFVYKSYENKEILTELIIEATNDEAVFNNQNLRFEAENTDRRVVVGLLA